MQPEQIRRYVALGDSFTEGLCDISAHGDGTFVGWADRLAMLLDHAGPRRTAPLLYANLAVRSKRASDVIADQLPLALGMHPDLVSVFVGANDLIKPHGEPVPVARQVERIVDSLLDAGAQVLLVNQWQPRYLFLHLLRARAQRFNALLRDVAARRGVTLLDTWNIAEFRQPWVWSTDRVHLNSTGHRILAYRAARALGVADARVIESLDARFHGGPRIHPGETAAWMYHHVLPWAARRLQGKFAGDGLPPKRPQLLPVGDWEPVAERA